MQRSLFESGPSGWERIDAPDADVALVRGFIHPAEGYELLSRLVAETPWRQDRIRIFGREHDLPRLQQWFADPGRVYTWSGIQMEPLDWTPTLRDLRRRVETATSVDCNSVLLNYYRDGEDTVGWHADDEPDLGDAPLIASISLGAERDFVLRHRTRPDVASVCIALPHGSLLVMGGQTQTSWLHALPRRKRVREPRLNLTFRSFR